MRLILESLACAHAAYAEQLTRLAGSRLGPTAPIHLIGGGARNRLLAQMTATACGREVIVGAVEASATGNLLAQLEALGITRPEDRGQILNDSCSRTVLAPQDGAPAFDAMRARLAEVRRA